MYNGKKNGDVTFLLRGGDTREGIIIIQCSPGNYLMALQFEWDEEKAKIKLRKHQVDFQEAKSVFGDPFSITIDDPDHSEVEQRFIDIGRSASGRLLVVVYTERENQIRIISCRKATPIERRKYEEQSK
jgi:uncharacterized DUF497 family protein